MIKKIVEHYKIYSNELFEWNIHDSLQIKLGQIIFQETKPIL